MLMETLLHDYLLIYGKWHYQYMAQAGTSLEVEGQTCAPSGDAEQPGEGGGLQRLQQLIHPALWPHVELRGGAGPQAVAEHGEASVGHLEGTSMPSLCELVQENTCYGVQLGRERASITNYKVTS